MRSQNNSRKLMQVRELYFQKYTIVLCIEEYPEDWISRTFNLSPVLLWISPKITDENNN